MSDWETSSSEDDTQVKKASVPVRTAPAKKWEGEDEDEEVASDWEASSDEEEEVKAPVAAPKKKGTLKQKLAEKEVERAQRTANGEVEYDSDEVLDPREKARRDKERELKADLANAADLLGAAPLGGTSSSGLDAIISKNPRTKEDFHKLSSQIFEFIIKRHESKPLYPAFIEHLAREMAQPLKDVEVRKVASGLTTLANEKQKEQRDKGSGKKKSKAKPALGGVKTTNKLDTNTYEESLDDFGNDPNDFM